MPVDNKSIFIFLLLCDLAADIIASWVVYCWYKVQSALAHWDVGHQQ